MSAYESDRFLRGAGDVYVIFYESNRQECSICMAIRLFRDFGYESNRF